MPRTSKTYNEQELTQIMTAALGLAGRNPQVRINHTPEQSDGPCHTPARTELVVSYDEKLEVPA